MLEKQISALQSLLDEKRSVFIFPVLRNQEDSLLASLALFFSLENSGQKANLILGSLPWNVQPWLEKNSFSFQPKLIIRRPSSGYIKQLHYEKQSNQIILSFDTNNEILRREDFDLVLSPQPEPELLITLGARNLKDISHPLFQKNISLVPIINIDHHSSNQQFGQINLVKPQAASLCQWLTEILRQLSEDIIDARVASYLLQGIKLLPPEKQDKASLQQMHYLIEKGALESQPLSPLMSSQPQINFLQNIIKKIQFFPESEAAFILLEPSEFRFISPPYLTSLIKELKSGLFHFKNVLLLWAPDHQTVQGIISLHTPKKLEQILSVLKGNKKGEVGLFRLTNTNLSAVRDKLQQLLTSSRYYEHSR